MNTSKKYKAVRYARVSTEDEGQTLSYEMQKKFEDERFDIIRTFDDRASGTSLKNRKGFLELLEYVGIEVLFSDEDYSIRRFSETDIEVIIVSSTSRMARNTEDALRLVKALHRNEVKVYFQDLNKYSDSKELEMVLPIYYALDEQYSKDISKKVKTGMDRMKGQGYVLTNNRIYGFRRDGDKLVKDDKADIVFNMFKDYIEGEGDRGIAVKYGVPYTTVRGILVNPKYMGYMKYNVHSDEPELVKTPFIEPIVSEEMFNQAQEVRKSRCKKGNYMTQKRRPLTSKLICGCCGKKLHYKARETQWKCGSKTRREGCDLPVFNSKKLIKYLEKVFENDNYLHEIEYMITVKLKGLERLNKSKLEKDVRGLENKKLRLLDLYEDGEIDKETYKTRNDKHNQSILKLKEEINNIDNHNQYIKGLEETEKTYKKRINILKSLLEQKEYDKLFEEIENVYIDKYWSSKGFSAEVQYVTFKGMELLDYKLKQYYENEYFKEHYEALKEFEEERKEQY